MWLMCSSEMAYKGNIKASGSQMCTAKHTWKHGSQSRLALGTPSAITEANISMPIKGVGQFSFPFSMNFLITILKVNK